MCQMYESKIALVLALSAHEFVNPLLVKVKSFTFY